MNKLNMGEILDCFCKGIKFAELHRPEEAIPDSYDKYEPGFIIALMLQITAAKKKMLNYSQPSAKF